jgi:hypothetical protein
VVYVPDLLIAVYAKVILYVASFLLHHCIRFIPLEFNLRKECLVFRLKELEFLSNYYE